MLKYKFKRIYEYCRYDIPRGIKNLVVWFPTVWRDRQWDFHYIYLILRHKLYLAEQSMRYDGIHVDNTKDADRMLRFLHLLDSLIEDKYHEIAFKNHDKEWGKPTLEFVELPDKEGLSKVTLNRPNVKTKEDERKERKSFMRACEIEDQFRKADLNELFRLMEKHIQEWWS